jgi:hypothetical protein
MIEYNLKIIFSNKFVWFLLGAILFFLGMSVIYVLQTSVSDIGEFYGVFIFCGVLLIFYPTVFGIQNDQDAKTIEILFGIPNYRYKVWLVRIVLMFVIAFLIMLVFSYVASLMIIKFNVLQMTYQIMIPVVFLGMLSFMMSTVIRNGNGTAVVMIIIGIIFMFMGDAIYRSPWNIFHNPFNPAYNVTETAWALITLKSRIILACGSVLFLLAALLNLQRREKFM